VSGDDDFAGRYGPWALVAGASEGIGAAYARAMARRGLNVVLLARRQSVLEDVAEGIRGETGVETRVAPVDLSGEHAVARTVEATSGIDVGMLMYCAGADPNYQPFLDNPIEVALSMVKRNCVVPMALCHHFAGPMVARGKGGIVLVSSGAGLAGGPNMVAYGATKAFDIVMAEALWTEVHERGVDVLGLVLGVTDTPALRRLLAQRGVIQEDDGAPIPGAVTAEDTVDEAIANLSNGPTWFVGEQMRQGARQLGAMDRNDAVRLLVQSAGGIMDNRDKAEDGSPG
jgi:uncharacterized protein